MDRLLEHEKLVLLVDLDQTLIHTTNDNIPNNIKVTSVIKVLNSLDTLLQYLCSPNNENFRLIS